MLKACVLFSINVIDAICLLKFFCYTISKKIKCTRESEILHELVCDTTQISLCFSAFRGVSRNISCSISESPHNFTSFLYVRLMMCKSVHVDMLT